MALARVTRLLGRHWITVLRPGTSFDLHKAPFIGLLQKRNESASFSLRWSEVHPYNAVRVQLGAERGGVSQDMAGFRAALRC